MTTVPLLVLALAAPVGTSSITVSGTVTAPGSTLADPALSSVTTGTTITLTFDVETPGFTGGQGDLDFYAIDPSTVVLRAGATQVAGGGGTGNLFLINGGSGGIGSDVVTTSFDLTPSVSADLTLIDSSGNAIDQPDLSKLIGTSGPGVFDIAMLSLADSGGALTVDVNAFTVDGAAGGLGTAYCGPAALNSSGLTGNLSAVGSDIASANNVTLVADSLVPNVFGFVITSQTQGFTAQPGGSAGNLCLSGSIGRYVGPGQVANSGPAGTLSLALDLSQTPQPNGFVAVAAGDTWNFQVWYRDSAGGSPTSNFTQGLEIEFQ
ncbi:MAG: hypothetical protein AAGG01_02265 [Planctomycetota bacterium]